VTAKKFAAALSADRPELRMAAANALGRMGETSAVPHLVKALSDEDAGVRERVAAACGRLGHPGAIPGLVARLSDGSVEVRRAAADALATIGTEQALSPLIALVDDGSETIRRIAVSALGNAGNARPVPHLVGALSDDSRFVRRAAVFSLVELLSNAPPKQSHGIREAVVDQLSGKDDEAIVVPLVEILDGSVRAPQRRNAAWLLGHVAGEEQGEVAAEALVSVLADEDRTSAQFASVSLVEIGGEPVETRLLRFVDDLDNPADARAKAVFVLGQIGGDRSRERLKKLTSEDGDKAVRKQAFGALSKLGGRA
jgi:HEAT repeat protein